MNGTYALLIDLPEQTSIEVGRLGEIRFDRGFYAYIGSAMNGLENRIERHLGEDKKLYWHIDYLLEESDIEKVLFGVSDEKKECEVAEGISDSFTMVKNFGSSDCECDSHLFHSKGFSRLEKKIRSSFKESGLTTEEW